MTDESFYDAQPQPPDLKRSRRQGPVSSNGHVDQLPPWSCEMEQGLLGCLLLSPKDCLPQIIEKFSANSDVFYDLRHQTIYDALIAMWSLQLPIDVLTLQQWLKDDGMLEGIGGVHYLNSLQDAVPSAANLSYYSDVVFEKHILRSVMRACTEIIQMGYEAQEGFQQLLDKAERMILAVGKEMRKDGTEESMRTLVPKAMAEIEARYQNGGAITGLGTGLADIDFYTDGLHPGEMTVIAAYPSIGKTALAMNITENVAMTQGQPVGVFSLEMTSIELTKRTICSVARVNLRAAADGVLRESDFPKLISAAGRLSAASIYIDDTSGLSIHELRGRARRMWQKYGVKLFVVDYLQLANSAGGSRKTENRQQEVSDISNGIKSMAKEFRVPVIVLSQLNDDGKLRESRAIGQDADGIWVLEDGEDGHVLWIRKQRNGPRNVGVKLVFLAEFTRFESAARVSDYDVPTTTYDNQPPLPTTPP